MDFIHLCYNTTKEFTAVLEHCILKPSLENVLNYEQNGINWGVGKELENCMKGGMKPVIGLVSSHLLFGKRHKY